MYSKFQALLRLSLLLLLGPIACVHEQPKQTVHLCNANGCGDVPKNYSTFDPQKNAPDDDPGGRIAALENMAQNDPSAAYDLALRLFRGDGVKQDSYRAFKWMREAAEKGDFEAQKAMGRVYLTGLEEMGPDYGEAQKWLNITASRGDKEAEKLLRQANEVRASQQEQYQWYSRQRSIFYNYWYSGYRYNWFWRGGAWGLY